jgi:hypothetical protein
MVLVKRVQEVVRIRKFLLKLLTARVGNAQRMEDLRNKVICNHFDCRLVVPKVCIVNQHVPKLILAGKEGIRCR